MVSPEQAAALVVLHQGMLRFPYHTRYEYIEFAVFTLAARAQALISLHSACVSLRGRAALLIGASGSGKSTLSLHCMLDGFDMLSEDAVFVDADTLRATGVANFLHVRPESLRWLQGMAVASIIRGSPIIRRRSGARKFEVDLRQWRFRAPATPPLLTTAVIVSPAGARGKALLEPISTDVLARHLSHPQAYAAGQPNWRRFVRKLSGIRGYVLRRGRHPRDAVDALRTLMAER